MRLPVHIFELPSTTYGSQAATVIVDVGGCSESTIDVTFHYEDTAPAMGLDFSRTLTVPMGSASVPTHVIFPVYALHRSGTLISWFAGVDMPSTAVRCVQLRSMQNAGMAVSAPRLAATLISGWTTSRLYQRIDLMPALPLVLWRPLIHFWRGITELG